MIRKGLLLSIWTYDKMNFLDANTGHPFFRKCVIDDKMRGHVQL